MITRHHLDKRRVAAAGVPVTMLQPKRLTQPQAALGQKRPQQPVPDAAPPLAGLHIPGRARIADPLDLARRQQGRHCPSPPPHPDHRPATATAASGMLQHRLVAAASAMHQADQIPAKLHPVELVVAVARDNRLQPRRDRGLREPRRPALDRYNLRAIPGAQPRQEPAGSPPASPHPRPARMHPGTATTAPAPAHTTSPCSARPAEPAGIPGTPQPGRPDGDHRPAPSTTVPRPAARAAVPGTPCYPQSRSVA